MEQGNERPGAVILGGSFHSLGAARNLAEHGVPVCILDSAPCKALRRLSPNKEREKCQLRPTFLPSLFSRKFMIPR